MMFFYCIIQLQHDISLLFSVIFLQQQPKMNKQELVYSNFTMDKLDQVVKMAADAFQHNNVFSKQGLETREELQFRTSVSLHLFQNAMEKYNSQNNKDIGFIKILSYRGKVIATAMAAQFHIFCDDMLSLLDPQDPYISIFKEINKQTFEKNSALFASLLVVHKDYMQHKVSNILIVKMILQGMNYGFKTVIGCSTNPISLNLGKKYGGKLIKQVQITRYGKTAPMYVMSVDFKDLIKAVSKL